MDLHLTVPGHAGGYLGPLIGGPLCLLQGRYDPVRHDAYTGGLTYVRGKGSLIHTMYPCAQSARSGHTRRTATVPTMLSEASRRGCRIHDVALRLRHLQGRI